MILVETIFGIGTDLCEVARIKESIENHPFFKQFTFTASEIIYCEQAKGSLRFQRYAARFAAKGAVGKAMGGMPYSYLDVSVTKEDDGKPKVVLFGKAKEFADRENVHRILLSLSHIENAAIAYCVAVKRIPIDLINFQ